MTGNTKPRAAEMTIGALSERTCVNIETIRYYERIGLLPPPRRSEGRHRIYDNDLAQRLQFIRRSRELGFSIEDIRTLLRPADQGGLACEQVQKITVHHLSVIRGKIADLKRMERALAGLAKECDSNQRADCPILETLAQLK